jgi:HK97 family phage major capsid protein
MMIKTGAASSIMWGTSVATTAASVTTGIVGLEAALPPQYEPGAKWLANKATYATVRSLTDTTGRPIWNPNDSYPNFSNGQAASLLGYPLLKSQFMPSISTTTYPMLFGDFKGYFIADRVGLSIEVLREVAALRDMVVIYARKRTGGQLVKPWMMKVLYCSA